MNINMNEVVGKDDILFITLDTLRYDVAAKEYERGNLPNLCKDGPFEKRHTPGNFTYAAHQSFFGGFLPTPSEYVPLNKRQNLFFMKNQMIRSFNFKNAFLFEEGSFVEALANKDYTTICIGGVIFFSKINALCSNLPNLFQQSYWNPKFGVNNKNSTENQVEFAIKTLEKLDKNQRVFLFINVSAIHGPNYFYLDKYKNSEDKYDPKKNILASELDCVESQEQALCYVDNALKPLFDYMKKRNRTFCIATSDHGTCYGEDGYEGHNLSHEIVWNVPYKHFFL
ncbi:STM4013/SEN3800 family hydrolase [Clostridium massiliodielmoense]|uniref:STM4013/SEN3800 family hydrolase n=1 Tax=Clostridium massiliodielmoense TaxID=1776385 RepID=UPI0004D7D1B7|nr:STM4013/SEN3800 family hydrolase [Clostridium massiliodielmoense]KEH96783.1 metalloenzyme domain-containing protein [Clostridium botulinum C/D str. BKT12695]